MMLEGIIRNTEINKIIIQSSAQTIAYAGDIVLVATDIKSLYSALKSLQKKTAARKK